MSPVLRLLLLLAGLAAARAGGADGDGFPHQQHARLFPLCDGCHASVVGEDSPGYPDAASCTRCHDGTRVKRVSWTAPAPHVSNLRFSHATHDRASAQAGRAADCAACHQLEDGGRMAVTAPRAQSCFACHTGSEHLNSPAGCSRCHAALSDVASWDSGRIAALPQPATHSGADFLHDHGTTAAAANGTCATCHARESCERCHLNAERVPGIVALERDQRVAELLRGRAPRYDAPATHGNGTWEWSHGEAAASGAASCANCHARASCSACHLSQNAATLELLEAGVTGPSGVRYLAPPRVHAAGFERAHQASGARDAGCLGCHERSSCDQCHATLQAGGFHEPNFLAQHGPAAYGNDVACSSCHSTERFCRDCHSGTGRAGEGRSNVAFHTASPLWLLGHGQAARQSLEGCASCHAQSDCTRCHSSQGGWGVNPHGTGFNATRLKEANRLTCLRCHSAAELGGQ